LVLSQFKRPKEEGFPALISAGPIEGYLPPGYTFVTTHFRR